jgi:hypothetical protein
MYVYNLSFRGRRLVLKCNLRVAAPSSLLPPRINAVFMFLGFIIIKMILEVTSVCTRACRVINVNYHSSNQV